MKKPPLSTSATPDLKLVKRGGARRQTLILPNGLEMLEAAAARGLSQAAAASLLGLSNGSGSSTLTGCFKAQPEAREAWDRGLAKLEDELTGLLLREARKGSIAAIIFGLKNKAGWSDNGPRDTGPRETHVKITLNGASSREDWASRRALLTSGAEVPKPK